MIELLSDYVLGFKLHTDIIDDFDKDVDVKKLVDLKNEKGFILIDDRKYMDIGYVSQKQYENNKSSIWADIITVYHNNANSIIESLTQINRDVQAIIVLNMSSDTKTDTKVFNVTDHPNIVGWVNQSRSEYSHKPVFTPGVSLVSNNDKLNQKYKHPQNIDTDVFIVGRDITEDIDPVQKIKSYAPISRH